MVSQGLSCLYNGNNQFCKYGLYIETGSKLHYPYQETIPTYLFHSRPLDDKSQLLSCYCCLNKTISLSQYFAECDFQKIATLTHDCYISAMGWLDLVWSVTCDDDWRWSGASQVNSSGISLLGSTLMILAHSESHFVLDSQVTKDAIRSVGKLSGAYTMSPVLHNHK